jgi:hypothetical protein
MAFEPVEGGRYFIHVDQDTQSVYVSWQMNDVIRIDDEEPYTFHRYPRENRLLQSGDKVYEYDNNGNQIRGDTVYSYYSTYLDGYKVNWLVGVGTPGTGPINPTSTEGNTIMSAPSDSTTDTTPATS